MREPISQYFLKIATLVATRATCPRREVGCVITNKYNHIMATGYNGAPRAYPHCTDEPCGGDSAKTGERVNTCMATHAEQNALLQCHNTMEIHTIYCTTAPCITCAKLIANTTCQLVVFAEKYSDTSGVDMLKLLNIEVRHEEIKD